MSLKPIVILPLILLLVNATMIGADESKKLTPLELSKLDALAKQRGVDVLKKQMTGIFLKARHWQGVRIRGEPLFGCFKKYGRDYTLDVRNVYVEKCTQPLSKISGTGNEVTWILKFAAVSVSGFFEAWERQLTMGGQGQPDWMNQRIGIFTIPMTGVMVNVTAKAKSDDAGRLTVDKKVCRIDFVQIDVKYDLHLTYHWDTSRPSLEFMMTAVKDRFCEIVEGIVVDGDFIREDAAAVEPAPDGWSAHPQRFVSLLYRLQNRLEVFNRYADMCCEGPVGNFTFGN